MKVKPRSTRVEWKILNKYYGVDEMSIMFRDYSSYATIREENTFQEVFDELETVMNINYENR
tara:strand:- start:2 stop:187 length:186 start_codon:yes stop_codon:yes gene_type:complete